MSLARVASRVKKVGRLRADSVYLNLYRCDCEITSWHHSEVLLLDSLPAAVSSELSAKEKQRNDTKDFSLKMGSMYLHCENHVIHFCATADQATCG